jgi:UDP-N-acetylmuramate dehydrogenase
MLKYDEPMSRHCSLRAGGITREFCAPENIEELSEFLHHNNLPVLIVGLGSNLLVRDNGFDGVIIHTKNLKEMSFSNGLVEAEVGATLAKLSRFAETNLKHGAEFLSAIPGSVGGALAMNAGAFGSEIWQYVVSVTTINLDGKIQQRGKSDFVIDYRSVTHNHVDEFFISAQFNFDLEKANDNVRDLLHKRNSSQPIGLPSCGSVFKNPKGKYAAKLIEQSGLKGYCIGGACVSEKHANYIINQNNASASDIEKLILHIQTTVNKQHKIQLEPEIIII